MPLNCTSARGSRPQVPPEVLPLARPPRLAPNATAKSASLVLRGGSEELWIAAAWGVGTQEACIALHTYTHT